ncbi:sensor histidine kinase [Cellulosilyticum sp. I15G10I2]|uniref:sensor histidine kinase n=1 Tax=Cellulosilyticum sp. I15G10I2 TaxID=1892843 RepID=UPI00085C4B78|nr:HAMP domain-containing sensor histidine kinase [Cellulosilyticum sp. I15G10I2]
MKKYYFLFYLLIFTVYLLPFIPLSVKGILGVTFIIISSTKISLKAGLATATLCIILASGNLIFNINVDYKRAMVNALLGSSLYYITAFYFGNLTRSLKNRNQELEHEIEKRKKVETDLKKELILFKGLMDSIPSPIFFKDLNFKYIHYNRALEDILGISGSEGVGKTVYDLEESQLASIYEKMDLKLAEDLGDQTYEDVVRFVDGSLRNIVFNKSIFKDENELPIGIVSVMTDVTEKKETGLLKQIILDNKQMIKQLLENDQIKTEFFSNISHELRTPLNVILGSVQLMDLYTGDEEYMRSKEKVVRSVAIMKQNCYRLLKLVNNLIDISKIDAKAFKLHLKNCNIISVIEEITLSVSEYIENKGIKLIFDTDIEEKIMACDDEKIERILLNLLSNAVKFTPKGGVIFVNVHNKDNGLCIKVEDTGNGMPDDKQSQVFNRFYQVDEMFTRKHEGSGIGLSLVKSLVEMHGGTIKFASKKGIGTTFIIHLPFRLTESQEVQYSTTTKQDHIERISVEFSDIYSISHCG